MMDLTGESLFGIDFMLVVILFGAVPFFLSLFFALSSSFFFSFFLQLFFVFGIILGIILLAVGGRLFAGTGPMGFSGRTGHD